MKTFKGRPVVPGTAEATALVSHGGFNTLASFQNALQFGDKEAAFRFGTLVDALITEPSKVDYYFEQNINRFNK